MPVIMWLQVYEVMRQTESYYRDKDITYNIMFFPYPNTLPSVGVVLAVHIDGHYHYTCQFDTNV